MVTSILSIFEKDAYVLMDLGAVHSFISNTFAAQSSLQPIPLDVKLEILTPTRMSMWHTRILRGC